MIQNLFVYGTLMASAAGARLGKPQRERLQRESVNLGPACLSGVLFDLGRYPALVMPARRDEVVQGEVVRLANPISSFRWLDVYENIAPGSPANEYERVVCTVRLASGEDVEAWVYRYIARIETQRRVADGRWIPR